jgi:thiol-disulfide isomerase/thioredoxin
MLMKGRGMKYKALYVGLLAMAAVAQAVGQTKPVKDPGLIDVQGYQKILQENKGKPLVVAFWATWCEPCRDEFPMLNELAKQYAPQGVKVVGVNLDQDGDLILMRRFLARYKPVFPNYRKGKGEELAFLHSVMPEWQGALPASFFYAKDGTPIGHLVGASDHDTYDAAIRMTLSK